MPAECCPASHDQGPHGRPARAAALPDTIRSHLRQPSETVSAVALQRNACGRTAACRHRTQSCLQGSSCAVCLASVTHASWVHLNRVLHRGGACVLAR